MIDPELKAYIENDILPRYDSYDPAHRRDHIDCVIANSLRLAAGYPVEENMVYAIAAYHDLGVCRDRRLHHIYSGEMLAEDATLRRWFTEEQITVMREAVEDHRASSDHRPRTIYGMIVAEADRQTDPQTVMLRTVQYGLSHYPDLTVEEQYDRFKRHLTEKYGREGYLKLYLPDSPGAVGLEELRSLMERPEELRAAFVRLFEECTRG